MNLCENCNCVSALLFYWFCCFHGTGTDRKNLAGLRSYPDTVSWRFGSIRCWGNLRHRGNLSYPSYSEICSFLRSCFPFWDLP